MKRYLCLLLSMMLALSCLAGCGDEPSPTQTTPSEPQQTTSPTVPALPPNKPEATEPTLPPETTEPALPTDPALRELCENLPRMDGSTSLIPLEAGIRAALFGKSLEDATADVSHTTSWGSFQNLIDGNADLVFSIPLSKMQKDYAAEQGFTPELTPIAMEGFVFVVNAENPVDSLTQQQLRDIYSGKITNWSEVGGLDEEIIPYQRNTDSGSQNYMIEFMGSVPLMDAPMELRPASMVGLMDVIAVNDNSRAAIGYSVYAYAADMYGNGNEIKFIQVDGVAPGKATFADGSYPLMGYNYAVYNANEPEGSYVRRLVEWILSDDGQLAIARAGYVTVRDIGYDYAEKTIEKYEGVGLGSPAPETVPAMEYVLLRTIHHESDWGGYNTHSNMLPMEEAVSPDGIPSWQISGLTDQALQDEINDWINESIASLLPELDAMMETVERLNRSFGYSNYRIPNLEGGRKPIYLESDLKNGYLSLSLSLCYWKNGNDEHLKHYRTEAAVWDLLTGKRLSNEELFCEGVDIDAVLNAYIQEYTQTIRGEFRPRPELKQDFVALPESGWQLTTAGIYFDHGSDTFVNGEFISFDWFPDRVLASDIPRDFSGVLIPEDNAKMVLRPRTSNRDLVYEYYGGQEQNYVALVKEDVFPGGAKVNEDLRNYVNTYYSTDAIIAYFAGLGIPETELDLWWLDWYASILGGRYLLTEGSRPSAYVAEEDRFLSYPYTGHLFYDLQTGERVDWTDILKDGWLSGSTMTDSANDAPVDPSLYTELESDWFRYYSGSNQLCVYMTDGTNGFYLYIPGEYIRF